MELRPGPAPGARPSGVYLSPNDPFAVDWRPKGRPAVDVATPADLVKRGTVGDRTGGGVDDRELARVRERVSYLEGALAQAERVEAAAQAFSDALERRSQEQRERYEQELEGLRTLLDHKERELRTLALEMGKVQGRLEAAQARLLSAGTLQAPGAPAAGANQGAAGRPWTETTAGTFLIGVVTVGVVVLLLSVLT